MARFGRTPQTSPIDMLKQYGLILGRKVGLIALGWVVVYFISQPCRREGEINILIFVGLVIGAVAGLVAGWYIAQDAVEDSNLTGLSLYTVLVIASVAPMWLMDGLLGKIMGWPATFGGFMLLTAATLMALATAVWVGSAQD